MDKSDMVYEVSRFDPSAPTERLVERIGLVDRGGSLLFHSADGSEIACHSVDLDAEIAARPQLHEVPANQITRITANPAALAHLPFLLRMPGAAGDFDESRWSAEMREEHIDGSKGELREVFRVLYVNGCRWGAFETEDGWRLLPDDNGDWDFYDNGQIPALDMWGRITFGESASMTYGLDIGMIGLITPGVVITTWEPDEQDAVISLNRRGDDAEAFLGWLLDGGVCAEYFGCDEAGQILMTQLFVEVAIGHGWGHIAGDYLMAGTDYLEEVMGAYRTSEWTLDIGLDSSTVSAVLDRIVERGGPLADIVIAAREPDSPPGRARRAALDELANPQA